MPCPCLKLSHCLRQAYSRNLLHIQLDTHPEAAGALSLAAVGGGDGVVTLVGDGAAEVEAKVILEREGEESGVTFGASDLH